MPNDLIPQGAFSQYFKQHSKARLKTLRDDNEALNLQNCQNQERFYFFIY